ncbi:MAG: hypothetical protein ACLUIR_09445 [Faecalibacterium prausnitzii]
MKKNLPDRYFYPAVFIYEDGQEIAVDFPDLGVAQRYVRGRRPAFRPRAAWLRDVRAGRRRRAYPRPLVPVRYPA